MEIKKEFYLPNKSVLSLYNINLEEDFNLVTDKISNSLGNRKVDINGNLLISNGIRNIKLEDKKSTYRFYLEEDSIIRPLTSINYGHDIISFDKIDTFIRKNNNPKYLKALEELEKNRDFYKVERFLDQKYFLEIALENDYKKKEEMAKANEIVLRLGNRKV